MWKKYTENATRQQGINLSHENNHCGGWKHVLLHRLFSMGKPDSLTFPKRSRGLRRGELGKKKTTKARSWLEKLFWRQGRSLQIRQRHGYERQGVPRDLDQECPWPLAASSGATQTGSTFVQPSQGSSDVPDGKGSQEQWTQQETRLINQEDG